ncbi:MAG: AMP-binding protein, partial [bacterium]|nr:AMP-binding protein [bacterium]
MEVDASYHQERLWFIDAFETGNLYPGMPVYHNIPLVLSIEGNLEIKLMERAIHAVVQRHEALRTRIIMADGEPVQWIDETVDFKLRVRELPDDDIEPDMDRHTKAVGMALEEAKQPFPGNDSGEPLIRGMAIPVTNEKYILVITLHHSIADRDSLGILVREVLLCYNAYLKNSHPSLAELALHYADFSLYQQELPRDIVQSLLFYWRRQLGGTLEPLELPVDIPRARVHTFREGRCPVEVPPALSRKIGELCRRLSKQPFEVLLAAFKVLLHRYTGQEEVVVGIPASLRLQPGTENVIGPISNLLVLRSRLDPDSSFSRFFPDLCKTVAAAFENRDMPFDLLVSELNPQKDMGRTALFDVLFQYEKKQFDLPPVPGLNISVIETNLGWGKYDLNLLMMGGEDAFSGVLVFNRDYFLEDTVSRFARHYVNLLESITLNPGELLSKLSILSETERHRLLEEWNQTHAQYPEEKTIHRLFEDQVERVPHHIAVVSTGDGGALTYKDLNGKANRLAALLIEKGVGVDAIVAIMVDRSVEMIVGLLGILKAGGAYLPIDPDYPEERVDFMLKDSGAMVLLISEIVQSSNPKSETNPN